MEVGDLKVNLTLDADGFRIAATRAGEIINTLSRRFDQGAGNAHRFESAVHRAGGAFRHFIITVGAVKFALMDLDQVILGLPKSIATTAGEFQRMQTLMEGMSKEVTDTARKLDGVRDMNFVINLSKNAPFEIKALSDSFVKLKAAGIDPANGSMQALIDSVAKFGGSNETIKRASVAIQQMSGKGVISMEELRQQLGEAIPNAMQLMARGMGLSIAELTEKVSKGVVKSNTALARMFIQMELDARGAAKRMMNTIPGALSQLTTEWELFKASVADRGFAGTVVSALQELTNAMRSPEGKEFAKQFGDALRETTEFLVNMARWVMTNTDLVLDLGKALLALYGGSKLSGMFDRMRQSQADLRAEQAKTLASQLRGVDRQIRAYEAQGNALNRLYAMRERLENDAEARGNSAQKRAFDLEQGKANAARKQLQAVNDRLDRARQSLADAESKREAKFEDKKRTTVTRLETKGEGLASQLDTLTQRRNDAIDAQREANARQLAALNESRGQKEIKLQDRLLKEQQKLVDLEERRAKIMERAKNDAVRGIEQQNVARTKELEAIQKKISDVTASNLSEEEKTRRISELRDVETEKRTAHDRELTRLNEIRQRRVELEEIHRRELAEPSRPVKDGRGRFVSPDSAEGVAAIERRNQSRENMINVLRRQETETSAVTRSLKSESTVAQEAADALMRHKNVATEEVKTLQDRAATLTRDIESHKRLAQEIRTSGLSVDQFTAKTREQLQTIERSRQVTEDSIAQSQRKRVEIQQEFDAKSESINQSRASLESIDREIAKKTSLIEKNQAEIASVKNATLEKGNASNSARTHIDALQRQNAELQRSVDQHTRNADAIRNTTIFHEQARAAVEGRLNAVNAEIAALERSKQATDNQANAMRARLPIDDAMYRNLVKQRDELERQATALNNAGSAGSRFGVALTAVGAAVTGFVRSLASTLLFTGAFVLAIEGIMYAFDKLTRKTRDAEAAQQAYNRARLGMAAMGDVEKIGQQAKAAESALPGKQSELNTRRMELTKAEADVAKFEGFKKQALANGSTNTTYFDNQIAQAKSAVVRSRKNVGDLEKEIVGLNDQVTKFTGMQTDAARQLKDRDIAQFVSSNVDQIRKKYEERLDALGFQKKIQDVEREQARLAAEGNEKGAQAKAVEFKKLTEQYAAAKESSFNRASAEIVEKARTAGASEEEMAALTKGIGKERDGIRTGVNNALSQSLFNAPKKTEPDDWLQNFIEAQRIKGIDLVEVSRELLDKVVNAETIQKVADEKIDAMVKSKDGKTPVSENDSRIPIAKQMLAKNLMDKETNDALAKLEALRTRVGAERENIERAFTDGGQEALPRNPLLIAVDKTIAELEPKSALLKDSLAKLGMTWDQFKDKMRGEAVASSAAKTLDDLIGATKSLQEQNETDERARARRMADNAIAQMTRRVNAEIAGLQAVGVVSKESEEKIALLRKWLADYTIAENDRVMLSSRTAIQTMSADWKQGMRNLEQAGANWVSSFIDQLVDGNLKFKDFVQGILKDIAKIKLKETLSTTLDATISPALEALGLSLGLNGAGRTPRVNADGSTNVRIVNGLPAQLAGEGALPTSGRDATQISFFEKLQAGLSNTFKWVEGALSKAGQWIMEAGSTLFNSLGNILSNIMSSIGGGGGGGGFGGILSTIASFFAFEKGGVMTGSGPMPLRAFANGGVMTSFGEVPLRKYANGGIAKRPQLALYGEGKKPEAYVPLPDGRTIPVTMTGGIDLGAGAAPQTTMQAPQVTFNLINQTGTQVQAEQRGMKIDGRKMVLDVVLSAASSPGPFRDNLRSAMSQK